MGGSKFLDKKYGISPKTIEHWIEKAKKNIDLLNLKLGVEKIEG